MNVAKRIKRLQALLDIRIGPGAAVLSSDVRRIHLDFAQKINDGHFGARKVWRTYLPRLKYHNPAVSMTVNRTIDQKGPATLTIHLTSSFSSQSATSTLTPPSKEVSIASSGYNPADATMIIDMKHKHESDILSQLLELTKGIPYQMSPEELIEVREVEDQQRDRERDKAAQMRLNEVRRREKALLDQARGNLVENS